ncbi:electron transport complex protein RnfD [Pelagirhabdus alkalitolerans]|uniref:Electron transport complex protein RnfD n=1 Tax=Pelagirhabdus alkalitolerans TaxID=1612202 RepID=A0A1G6LQ86_9BACI|nr:RnfABCDGE type electron transport complex subunit D [Pelagirhabdus alkalitolerans]SDC45257.1 electron transport complex protein RnfD [Pelagirhabdus alkalitolerans]
MGKFNTSALNTTPAPHLRSPRTSDWVMRQVIYAMMIPTAGAVYFFGYRVFLMLLVGVGASVAFEYIYQKLAGRKITINDYSAVVTGWLIALSLPLATPLWTVALGGVVSIAIKQIFGGIGKNPINPAVFGRIFLSVLYYEELGTFVAPRGATDAFSSATPLNVLKEDVPIFADAVTAATGMDATIPSLWDLFLGTNLGGNIGDTSTLLLLLAFGYLVARRIIEPYVPVLYVLPVALIALVTSGFDVEFMMQHVLSGSLVFAAVFMVTDYSSSPFSPHGKVAFATGAGILTILFRFYSSYPGGVGFAILTMNIFVPIIDRLLPPRIYGHKKRPS